MTRELEKIVAHLAFANSSMMNLQRISADGAPPAYSKELMNAISANQNLINSLHDAKEDKRISEI